MIFCISCEKSNDKEILWWHNADIVELDASNYTLNISDTSASGSFVKFSFMEGDIVTHNNWDVAFRGTTIIINGGDKSSNDQPERTANAAVYIATSTMSQLNLVDTTKLLQDNSSGSAILNNLTIDDLGVSGNGWASYNFIDHIISPIPGRILVFRTHDNKYAKMEILYFYDSENPSPSEGDYGGYYTFNYVYNENGGIFFP